VALRLDREASEETFPKEARDACDAVKAILERNEEATEVAVHRISSLFGAEDGKYAAFDAKLSPCQLTGIINRICEKNVRSPFEKRSVVHAYHMDSVTYAVEQRLNTGDTKIKCWDERCCALDARPEKGIAISAQHTVPVKPHMFTSRADVHHAERFERLSVDMTSGVFLQIEILCEDERSYFGRARVVYRRSDYAFPYRTVCRALTCLMGGDGAAAAL
jgi:hypothetical protein